MDTEIRGWHLYVCFWSVMKDRETVFSHIITGDEIWISCKYKIKTTIHAVASFRLNKLKQAQSVLKIVATVFCDQKGGYYGAWNNNDSGNVL